MAYSVKLIASGCAHSFLISLSFLSTVAQNPELESSRCAVRCGMCQIDGSATRWPKPYQKSHPNSECFMGGDIATPAGKAGHSINRESKDVMSIFDGIRNLTLRTIRSGLTAFMSGNNGGVPRTSSHTSHCCTTFRPLFEEYPP